MKKEREDKEREGRGCPILRGNRAWMKELCRLTWCDSIDVAQHLPMWCGGHTLSHESY
jgi:hypothetical protein